MPSLIALKKRIGSVTNIAKITKAMEMVSASKMRQAQIQALNSRHYARKLDEILTKVSQYIDINQHDLLHSHTESNKEAIFIISTDRGLTGSLNANLFKTVEDFQANHKADIYTVGKIAREYAVKSDFDLVAAFDEVGEKIEYETTQTISHLLRDEFIAGKYSKIHIAYMDFISTLKQEPRVSQLLPIYQETEQEKSSEPGILKEYTFEPSPKAILDSLLPYFIEMKVYQSMLEARASEHSARMVAMKNASENATELKGDLSLDYNRSRQANITNELADIVTATMSLS